MRSLIGILGLMTILAGCQNSEELPRYSGWIGTTIESRAVTLDNYEPPETLGAFRLQGEMELPERNTRMFRYQAENNPERTLDILLYPLPPGWDDLPPGRSVAGHYGTVKQTLAQRVTQRNRSDLEALEERLYDLEGLDSPVAEGLFLETTDTRARTLHLQVAARPPVFVRATASTPGETDSGFPEETREAVHTFLRQHTGSAVEDQAK